MNTSNGDWLAARLVGAGSIAFSEQFILLMEALQGWAIEFQKDQFVAGRKKVLSRPTLDGTDSLIKLASVDIAWLDREPAHIEILPDQHFDRGGDELDGGAGALMLIDHTQPRAVRGAIV